MEKLQLIATTVFGLEAVVARELKWLGYDDQFVENGRVTFSGDFRAIAKTNIWLRSAERVLLKMGEFKALTFEELFCGTKELPWENWLPRNANFPVEGKSINSKLFSVPDCQAIVKKAIVERLKTKYKCDWFDETGPRYKIEVSILKDIVTLTIDTSGIGLHKRGYRKLVGVAPIKETMASAILHLSYWKEDRALIDPFCGTGTIPIEACMMALNIAPGLNREFDAMGWRNIPENLWREERELAKSAIRNDLDVRISGIDIDENAISIARYHAKLAGVSDKIHLQKMHMKDISSRYKYGSIVCNPPYGERIGEIKELQRLYKEMGRVFRKFDTWSYYIISSMDNFEKLFGMKADKKRKLYNGRIQCNLYQYFGEKPKKKGLAMGGEVNDRRLYAEYSGKNDK